MGLRSDLMRSTTPEYSANALSDVLPSALAALGVPGETDTLGLGAAFDGVDRVVILLIDGLGHHLYPRAAVASTVLSDVVAGHRGSLRRLTTGFPSTTPTSLAGLATGATPGQHGILGFTVNVPETDRMLVHIQWNDDPAPNDWQPHPTCFERAAAVGVRGHMVDAFSAGLSKAIYRGAVHHHAADVAQLRRGVNEALKSPGPAVVMAYYPGVDKAGHLFGVGSPQWHAEVALIDGLLEGLLADLGSDTALLVTADHGMIDVPETSRIRMENTPTLRDGVRLIGGEPRARYVYTEPGAADEVAATWRDVLGEYADVVTRAEVVAAGWFGPVVPAHLPRIGDLVVVCRDDYALFGAPEADSPIVDRLPGLHGGLTEAEMAVPLWTARG
ncbi:MAG TPA: alkaline phosphatase family protein [Candidatus Stackebrandtia excrementipullorum]|nr:alkaline phosphatase family protein [Candidatus Stackebrandtia excrementipullorum]